MNNFRMDKANLKVLFFLATGIMLRFIVMSWGHNYDFDSYCIVGEISGNLRNVYAETPRYNYAPVFMMIQGILYRISALAGDNSLLMYRVLMVSFLTLVDIGIAAFISLRYSINKALLFFLNPVSIIITGFHNQFDNVAVLLALLSILFVNEEDRIQKKDIAVIGLLACSLMTKHILFMFPIFILLMSRFPLKKRILYAIVPPAVFLLSFIPFIIHNDAALQGVINNVFLYRSFNNAPLLHYVYEKIQIPQEFYLVVYGIMMIILAFIVKHLEYEKGMLIYFIAMVSFSSAIANQYLAIPMAALCILNTRPFEIIYMFFSGGFLLLHVDGLDIISRIHGSGMMKRFAERYVHHGYRVAVFILLCAIIKVIYTERNSVMLFQTRKNTQ